MQAVLIYNPTAGQIVIRHILNDIIAFLNSSGWSIVLQETTGHGEATGLARSAAERGTQVVIAVGGDGTVSEVANGLIGTEVALGVLPVGTSNTWAIQMGIPTLNPYLPTKNAAKLLTDLEKSFTHPLSANFYRKVVFDAAKVLLEYYTVNVDMGKLADRYFLMWAGIGLDALVSERISLKEKQVLGAWAYVPEAIKTISRYPSAEIRLVLDGKEIQTKASLIVVSNIQLYAGLLPMGIKARINDAKLDVCVFKGDGFFTFLQHIIKVVSHRHSSDSRIDYYQCRRLSIESTRELPIHLDGEPFTKTPATIVTVPSTLKVIVPRKRPSALLAR